MTMAPLTALQPMLAGEKDRWLRRRFVLYCSVLASASALIAIFLLIGLLSDKDSAASLFHRLNLALALGCVLIYAAPLVYIHRRPHRVSRRALLRLSYAVTLAFAAVYILPSMALASLITRAWREAGNPNASLGPMIPWLLGFFASHLFASLTIPWRPREALLAYLPITLIMATITFLGVNDSWGVRLIGAGALLTVGLPGVLVCWVRHTRFARRFHLTALSEHYEETTRELTDAQRLHEAILPAMLHDDQFSLEFAYEPMRAIGGDFLYVHDRTASGARQVSFVLVDVTGHGIPAALTVHRLHGELERIYGERPDADPGIVLSQLNRYVHVALAKHSVYATAICVQAALRPGSPPMLQYASAGHPPALRVPADGAPDSLESTAFVLGAAGPDDFDPEPRELPLSPGDTLIAFTDGAFECRDVRGAMLGLSALRDILVLGARDAHAPNSIMRAVRDARRHAPVNDDTLIVSLRLHASESSAPSP